MKPLNRPEAQNASSVPADVPAHVGLILDGNRRWARARGLSSSEGHRRGAATVLESLEWAEDLGVSTLTLWLLSTDNFQRPSEEITELCHIIKRLVCDISARGFAVQLIGATNVLPADLAQCIASRAHAGCRTRKLHVNVAVGYGGRREILDATRAYLDASINAGLTLEQARDGLSEDTVGQYLYTQGQPDPDLIIRTSGEKRLSGFLLWQSVHSELVFCDALWPDFTRADFEGALREYAARERRYGA